MTEAFSASESLFDPSSRFGSPMPEIGGYSAGEDVHYLDSHRLNMNSVQYLKDIINLHLDEVKYCGKVWMKGIGEVTSSLYTVRLTCKEWSCEDCGADNGVVHLRRFARVKEIWGKVTEKSAVQQVVLTVPLEDRFRYRTAIGPGTLQEMAKCFAKKWFPGKPFIQFFHGFGEEHPGKFAPHVQVEIKAGYGDTLWRSLATLKEMRVDWGDRLKKNGGTYEGEVDIDYLYARGCAGVLHKLKYMCRPWPGPDDRKVMYDDPDLLYFFMVTMGKFKWMRFHGWKRGEIKKPKGNKDDLKGFDKLAGEKIHWFRGCCVLDADYDDLYGDQGYDELHRNFRRIRSP